MFHCVRVATLDTSWAVWNQEEVYVNKSSVDLYIYTLSVWKLFRKVLENQDLVLDILAIHVESTGRLLMMNELFPVVLYVSK